MSDTGSSGSGGLQQHSWPSGSSSTPPKRQIKLVMRTWAGGIDDCAQTAAVCVCGEGGSATARTYSSAFSSASKPSSATPPSLDTMLTNFRGGLAGTMALAVSRAC